MKSPKILFRLILAAVCATVLIYFMSPLLTHFRDTLLPDKGASWYYWKLPVANLWAGISVWTLYALHQCTVWFFIYKMQINKTKLKPDSLGKFNIAILIANAAFVLLHMLQTLFFYDGLAQYVPVFSSQASVIVMLVIMLILAADRRGLFFGKKIPFPKEGVRALTKTHGYFISWALIYTFWFHPIEGTLGHLLGFFYMYLLMIQMTLAHTKSHYNLTWITFLEVFVGIHGAAIALQSGSVIWSMFAFGFLMMFVVTQMYGIIKNKVVRIALTALYLLAAMLIYGNVFGTGQKIAMIHQIFWIPVILYGLVFVIVYGYQGAMWIGKLFLPKRNEPLKMDLQ